MAQHIGCLDDSVAAVKAVGKTWKYLSLSNQGAWMENEVSSQSAAEADIMKRVHAALEREPLVDLHRDTVAIDYRDGIATVSGEVRNIAAKRLTLELTAALPEVEGIVDRLYTRPAQRMEDGEIADHLEHSLVSEPTFDGCTIRRRLGDEPEVLHVPADPSAGYWIEFRVHDGVVVLDGDVPSLSHKRLAGSLVWWVPGSRDVVNGLGVVPAEQDCDDEILDALRLVLDKDPLLDPSSISARCSNAVITLNGAASSETQRHMAEFDAWSLFGVDKVVNRIEIVST